MKSLLALILLFAASLCFAADPVVVVTSITSVSVDGVPSGTVVDVLANVNRPNIRARLLAALIAYESTFVSARQAAETAKAAETARVGAIVAALKKVSPTILPTEVRAELQSANEKERATLLAAKAAAEAKLAALPP